MQREDALDAFAKADLADGEVGADALVRAGNAHAFEILDAGALAFDHLDANAQRVAGAEFGDRTILGELLDRFGFERLDEVHVLSNLRCRRARQRAVPVQRPRGARSGPAALAVYPRSPWLCAMQRSSHDPPIAALRGSCVLPSRRDGYNADIREAPHRSSLPLRWRPRPLRRGAIECKRRAPPSRPARRPTAHSPRLTPARLRAPR